MELNIQYVKRFTVVEGKCHLDHTFAREGYREHSTWDIVPRILILLDYGYSRDELCQSIQAPLPKIKHVDNPQ